MIPLDQLEYEEREHASNRRFRVPSEILSALLLLIPAVIITSTAQLMFKHGMGQVGNFDFQPGVLIQVLPKMLTNPFIWLGLIGEFSALAFYLWVISRVPLSLAYPILAMNYLVVVLESAVFLGETVSWVRVAGVCVIIAGVAIVGLSEGGGK
jgi:drug/metabolite transporter (DMT)-like permease